MTKRPSDAKVEAQIKKAARYQLHKALDEVIEKTWPNLLPIIMEGNVLGISITYLTPAEHAHVKAMAEAAGGGPTN